MPGGSLLRLPAAPAVALGLLVAAYVLVFGWLTWAQQSNFGTFGYDMGLYDQGIWLLSQFRDPFVTIRGLSFFEHHVNLIVLLLVPGQPAEDGHVRADQQPEGGHGPARGGHAPVVARRRSSAATNWSRSPSRTAWTLPVSTPVRWSLTIW